MLYTQMPLYICIYIYDKTTKPSLLTTHSFSLYKCHTLSITQGQFIHLDTRITTLLSHNMCPKIILTGYGYIRSFMIQQVAAKMAEAQGQGAADAGTSGGGGGIMGGLSGLAKSCSIS